MHPYLHLIRFDKPTGTFLLMFPCWWGVLAYSESVPYGVLALFAVGAFAMRSAGCVVNDMADRHIDAQVARTASRPLASGTVSMRQAYKVLALLLAVALGVALALGWPVVLLGACWLPLVVAYPFMKRITFWPQAFLGLTFGTGALFGMVAITGGVSATGLWLAAAGFFWVLGYDTIYACQDAADDARIGVKSTARLFGRAVHWWVAGFYLLMLACILMAIVPDVGVLQWVGFAAIAALLGYQLVRLDVADRALCMRLFKLNQWVGLVGCVVLL